MIGILEIDNFFSMQECNEAIALIEYENAEQSSLKSMPIVAKKYEEIILSRLPKTFEIEEAIIEITGISDKITFGKQETPIVKHVDKKSSPDNFLKLSIFLNRTSLNGGTQFENYYVPPAIGRAILFDIDLAHQSEDFPKREIKYNIGFRILGTKK